MSEPPFSRVGVVGLGLVGGSIALGARRAWPSVKVVGFDRSASTARAAAGTAVDETIDEIGGLTGCDLIVLAVPPDAIDDVIPKVGRLEADAIVTDVGSTKRRVMAAAAAAHLRHFVGGHPMAGSEHGGLRHARSGLFEERPWLLVAGSGSPEEDARVESFVRGLGAKPRWIDADRHDRIVAYVSHLPQLVAVALMNAARSAVGEEGLSAAGRAFAEMTRLASSPADLWQEILSDNADFVAEALDRFTASLPDDGQLDNRQWVLEAFARARASRAPERES